MQSGKSTLADILVRDYGFVKLKFAGPLKNMMRSLITTVGIVDANDEYIEDTAERMVEGDLKEADFYEFGGKTPRHLMQTLGTEWGRNCVHEDFWAMLAKNTAARRMSAGLNVVFDDMRFPNEAQALLDIGGHVVRVIRPNQEIIGGCHASEGGLNAFNQWTSTIINAGTIADLEKQAAAMLSFIKFKEDNTHNDMALER